MLTLPREVWARRSGARTADHRVQLQLRFGGLDWRVGRGQVVRGGVAAGGASRAVCVCVLFLLASPTPSPCATLRATLPLRGGGAASPTAGNVWPHHTPDDVACRLTRRLEQRCSSCANWFQAALVLRTNSPGLQGEASNRAYTRRWLLSDRSPTAAKDSHCCAGMHSMTASEALNHPWLTNEVNVESDQQLQV